MLVSGLIKKERMGRRLLILTYPKEKEIIYEFYYLKI